jgi:hypothetical protein
MDRTGSFVCLDPPRTAGIAVQDELEDGLEIGGSGWIGLQLLVQLLHVLPGRHRHVRFLLGVGLDLV